jgi:hypothetical protein
MMRNGRERKREREMLKKFTAVADLPTLKW